MTSTAFWAGYYGFRSDASEAFIQGYLDEVQRLDQRGQGVACGRGWIPRSKKCSRDKASQTSKEAKARTVEKARERAKLKGEVKAAKGQKPRVKEKPEPKTNPKEIKKQNPQILTVPLSSLDLSSEADFMEKRMPWRAGQFSTEPEIKQHGDYQSATLKDDAPVLIKNNQAIVGDVIQVSGGSSITHYPIFKDSNGNGIGPLKIETYSIDDPGAFDVFAGGENQAKALEKKGIDVYEGEDEGYFYARTQSLDEALELLWNGMNSNDAPDFKAFSPEELKNGKEAIETFLGRKLPSKKRRR